MDTPTCVPYNPKGCCSILGSIVIFVTKRIDLVCCTDSKDEESRLNNSLAIFDIVNGYITDTVMKGGSTFLTLVGF